MPKSYVAAQSYFFESSPRRVFAALSDPKELVRWFLSEAKFEPRSGGSFAFTWLDGYRMEGRLLELRKDRSVTFRWVDSLPQSGTAVTRARFQVGKRGNGTLLRLRHSGFRDPRHFAECSARWAYFLTNLKSVLDHGTDLRSPFDW
ncbi:MAG TPA: SRPBCC domain-containing protein [Thermoplasmata archaeon]|nr:SRPBCC domain-containing protein [Thermoplasmata archaeon]